MLYNNGIPNIWYLRFKAIFDRAERAFLTHSWTSNGRNSRSIWSNYGPTRGMWVITSDKFHRLWKSSCWAAKTAIFRVLSPVGNYNSSRASEIAEKVIKGSTTVRKDRACDKKAHRRSYVILCNLTVEIPFLLSELSWFAAICEVFINVLAKKWSKNNIV